LIALTIAMGIAAEPTIRAGEPRQLTSDGLLKRDPIFWPGGEHIVYTVEAPTGRMRLVRHSLADGTAEYVHEREDLSDRELSVSSDGSKYAYNIVDGLSSRIVVRDVSQSRDISVPRGEVASWVNWPSLSPDGKQIVFTGGAAYLYKYDLVKAGSEESLVQLSEADAPYSDLWPRFSPDGERIVFSSRRDNDFEIYTMNADGEDQRRLTESPGVDMHPVYSPNGERIAFTSNRDGNYEIYVMQADGSDPRRLTDHPERDDFPAWHPDGQHLVIISEREGRFDLYLIDVPE
jgi:Tol biopolymer transport system component